MRGTLATAAQDVALALTRGVAAGLPCVWHKSSGGTTLEWIGAQLVDRLLVSIPEQEGQDILHTRPKVLP